MAKVDYFRWQGWTNPAPTAAQVAGRRCGTCGLQFRPYPGGPGNLCQECDRASDRHPPQRVRRLALPRRLASEGSAVSQPTVTQAAVKSQSQGQVDVALAREAALLAALPVEDPATVGSLAYAVGLKVDTAAKALRRLENRGLAYRRPDGRYDRKEPVGGHRCELCLREFDDEARGLPATTALPPANDLTARRDQVAIANEREATALRVLEQSQRWMTLEAIAAAVSSRGGGGGMRSTGRALKRLVASKQARTRLESGTEEWRSL